MTTTHERSRTAAPMVLLLMTLAVTAMLAAAPAAKAQQAAAADTVMIDGLMWAVRSNGENVPWQPANEYCETLELAGHTDWRLPTLTEIETLYDPDAQDNDFIKRPLVLEDCCLWSATSLAELSPEEGGARGGQGNDPSDYFWGFLYPAGVRYYSINFFPDGQAHCVRDP